MTNEAESEPSKPYESEIAEGALKIKNYFRDLARVAQMFSAASGAPRHELEKMAVEPQSKIPGKLPKTIAGKLAVKAAWEIEVEERRRATAKEVMERLQRWADNGDEPDSLKESNKQKRAVIWITEDANEKIYTLRACEKTLVAWKKSRE